MSIPNPLNTDVVLRRLREVLQFDPNNVPALCQIGRDLARLGHGRGQEARVCYRAAVDAMRRAVREGKVEAALISENMIYGSFVKTEESEQHYTRCFSDWRGDFARLGMRFRQELEVSQYDAHQVAFFLHAGHMLGHTEVLFKLLEGLKACQEPFHPRIYVLAKFSNVFLDRAIKLGVEIILIETLLPGGRATPLLDRFLWLRERLRQDHIGVCIWVSSPVWASFALSMRLAPVQIFWALRFHPISEPDIDGYITYGARQERERQFGKQAWTVVPVPLALDSTPPDSTEVRAVRTRYPEPVLLGTLAREEKIHSEPFLAAVAQILKANPNAGYVWTGKVEHAGISGFFRAAGVLERCHFVGWVDTRLYAGMLDLFLETFPIGCGVTGYQALGAGTPLLSYLAKNTVFGMQFWSELGGAPQGSGDSLPQVTDDQLAQCPVLCARNPDEYVSLAGRLISEPAFRAQVADRGKRFFEQEINNGAHYSQRFFGTIAEIADRTIAARKAQA